MNLKYLFLGYLQWQTVFTILLAGLLAQKKLGEKTLPLLKYIDSVSKY